MSVPASGRDGARPTPPGSSRRCVRFTGAAPPRRSCMRSFIRSCILHAIRHRRPLLQTLRLAAGARGSKSRDRSQKLPEARDARPPMPDVRRAHVQWFVLPSASANLEEGASQDAGRSSSAQDKFRRQVLARAGWQCEATGWRLPVTEPRASRARHDRGCLTTRARASL